MTDDRAGQLADALVAARTSFWGALDALPAERRLSARLVGEWGERELVAHLGYWAGHCAEAIHRVERGEAEAFDAEGPDVDARNATVARIAHRTPLPEVRSREAAAAEALVERLRALDPELLDVTLPDGGTLEDQVRTDGAEHYLEHAGELSP